MHELPVTESILDIVLRSAEKSHASRIAKIHLVIGQLASIVDDSVQFYWDIISAGTPAEGAILSFHRIQTRFQCNDCELIFSVNDYQYVCPDCGSLKLTVINGNEFYVESIDIEI